MHLIRILAIAATIALFAIIVWEAQQAKIADKKAHATVATKHTNEGEMK